MSPARSAALGATAVIAVLAISGCAHRQAHAAGGYDRQDQIEMLAELRDKGVISDDEFEEKKKRILSR